MRAQRLTLLGTAAAGGAYVYYATADAATQFSLISAAGPALRLLDPETSHNLGIEAAKLGLLPRETRPDPPVLSTRVWARQFTNPIGARGRAQRRQRRLRGRGVPPACRAACSALSVAHCTRAPPRRPGRGL